MARRTKAARCRGRFARAERGNVGLVFALVLFVLLIAVAGSVDVGDWIRARSMTRAAVDSALFTGLKALQIERLSAPAATEAAMRAYAENIAGRAPVDVDTIAFHATDENTALVVSGTVVMQTSVLGLFGIPAMPVVDFDNHTDTGKAIRTVGVNAVQSLETVLVAGLPSRLAPANLDGLKAAARTFADLLVWPLRSGHASRLGIVPYSTAVNAGSLAAAVSHPATATATFTLYNGTRAFLRKTPCVGERYTDNAFNDAAPTGHDQLTALFSRLGNCQPTAPILLPTADRGAIGGAIDAMTVGGTSAGHIGLAWAWYLLSPSWAGTLPFEAAPASYALTRSPGGGAPAPVRKVMLLISDGGFDTQTCVASVPGSTEGSLPDVNSLPGSVPDGQCVSPNGPSATQSRRLCDGMKASGVAVFTIVYPADDPAADARLMADCASSREHAFRANTQADLLVAVRNIALRLTSIVMAR